MKKLLFLMLVIALTATAHAQLSSEFFDIEIKEVNPNNSYIWNDRGSGADADVAFWKVIPSPGYYTLGHFTTSYHQINPDNGQKAPVTITLRPKPGYESLLAAPIGYDKIWDDAGSGSDDDVQIWRMKCPEGYVSVGDVATAKENDKSPANDCRCIKRQARNSKGETINLVTRANYLNFAKEGESGPKAFWTDSGSGANKDVSIWLMNTNQTPPKRNQVYMVASTFRANKYHTAPPAEDCYALVLEFPQNDILERVDMLDKKVKLKGPQLPSDQEMKASEVVQEYTLPFFAVQDPDYKSQLAQFLASPTYKVKRFTSFVAIDSYEPINTETKEFSVTTGKSEETNYNNEVGVALGVSVEVGGEAGIAVAGGHVNVTASVEVSYSHSWGGATSNYEERSFTYPQTVTGGCFGVLFQAKSTYMIYRKDGSMVGSPVEVKVNEFYTDEWCPEGVKKEDDDDSKENRRVVSSPNTITFTIDAPPGKTVILEGRLEIYDGKVVSTPEGLSVAVPARVYQSEVGKVIKFASANDIISTGKKLSPSYTKLAWVKMESVPNSYSNNIISGTGESHAFFAPGNHNNCLSGGHNNKWDYVKSPTPLTTGWHHVAVSYDATRRQMKLYQDGELVSSNDNVPNFNSIDLGQTQIGGYNGAHNFRGEIKDAQIWDSVLTDEQIKNIYKRNTEGICGSTN